MLRLALHHATECRLERWHHTPIARPYWRLYWNQDPGWEIIEAGRRTALGPARLILVAPETVYRTAWQGPSRHLFLHFTTAGLPGEPLPGIHLIPCNEAILCLLTQVRAGFAELDAYALACHALARLPASAFATGERSPGIARAAALAGRFIHRQVANAELAKAAGMQPNAFIRRFRDETGCTPQRWHHQRRIDAACLALESETTSIDELAARFGFCDRHHFTRVFTRLRGIAPAAYRVSADGGRVNASKVTGKATRTAKTTYVPPGRQVK